MIESLSIRGNGVSVRELAASRYFPLPATPLNAHETRLIRSLEVRWFGSPLPASGIKAADIAGARIRRIAVGSGELWTQYEDTERRQIIATSWCQTTTLDREAIRSFREKPRSIAATSHDFDLIRGPVDEIAIRKWEAEAKQPSIPQQPTFLAGPLRFDLLAELLFLKKEAGTFLASLHADFLEIAFPDDAVSYRIVPSEGSQRAGEIKLEGYNSKGHLVERAEAVFSKVPPMSEGGKPSTCPQLPAISAPDGEFSAERSAQEVDGWISRLAKLGVREGSVVAVCLERRAAAIFLPVALSALKAVYFPINADNPPERLERLLREAQPLVLVTESAWMDRVCAGPWHVLTGEPEITEAEVKTGGNFQGCAYLMTTSGSTGEPKLHHFKADQVAGYLAALSKALPLDAHSRYLHSANFGFSASIRQMFFPLHAVCPLVLASHEERASPRRLAGLIAAKNISFWDTIPSVWRKMDAPPELLSGLTGIFLTGELLTWECCRQWRDRYPGDTRIYNLHSQTETCGSVAIRHIDEENGSGVVPLGKPLMDVVIRMEPREDLEGIAELEVGGPRFSGRFIRTGDLFSRSADHGWRFAGRCDRRVKIRGMQVNLDEVEAAIRRHPDILETAVIKTEGLAGTICAWVVTRDTTSFDESALRDFLRGILPSFKIPAAFYAVDALPLTSSGKIAWRELKVPAKNQEHPQETDGIDRRLRRIWEDTLGRPVPADVTFRDLGGDSLGAASLITSVEKEFGNLQGRMIGELTTLRTFAEFLQTAPETGGEPNDPMLDELLKAVAGRPGFRPSPNSLMVRLTGNSPSEKHLFFIANGLSETVSITEALEGKAQVWMADSGYGRLPRTVGSIRSLAARHVRDILKIQPHGPIQLLGYSFSCVIATEIANQLVAAGRSISALVWLDNQSNTTPAYQICLKLDLKLKELCQAKGIRARASLLSTAFTYFLKLAKATTRKDSAPGESKHPTPDDPDLQPYIIAPSDLRIILFASQSSVFRKFFFPTSGWKPSEFPRIKLVKTPGDHHSMLSEPANVQVLVSLLKREMNFS